MNKTISQRTDRRKILLTPLFTSYVFVNVHERDHLLVKQTDGILNFVYWLGKPAMIKQEEIDAIKKFLSEHDEVKLEKMNVDRFDTIRIVNGPLKYLEGNVVEVRNHTLKVSLPSLGCMMVAEVQKSNVQIIVANRITQIDKIA